MKKGDIVELKANAVLVEAMARIESYDLFNRVCEGINLPSSFTIKDKGKVEVCGENLSVLEFEEIGGKYTQRHFKRILKAGEPSLGELLKQEEVVVTL